MTDFDTITKLKKSIFHDFKYKVVNEKCTELYLNSENNIFSGSIRHLPESEKYLILEEISKLTDLQVLDLAFNKITHLPDSFLNLKKLKHVNFKSCRLAEIPLFLKDNTDILSLNLSSNNLKKIPDFINDLTKLQNLNLSKNIKLQNIDIIQNINNLQVLDLYLLSLKTMPEFIYKLKYLESIFLWNVYKFKSPLNCFPNLKNIRWYGSQQLKELPDGICMNQSILNFDFAMNNISLIPTDIKNLKNLKNCSFHNNVLTTLPDEFFHLTQLKKLDISNNQFKHLPEQLFSELKLDWMGCYNNPLTSNTTTTTTTVYKRPFTS